MLTSEQAKQIRAELLEQVESSFPEDKKAAAKEQVEAMSSDELEKFVKQDSSSGKDGKENCIFCSIVSGNSESFKVAENDSAIAVLEINPVSRGHVIVLPKEHKSYKESPEAMEFAKQVALLLREKLKPKDIEIASIDFQGHGAINLIPVYTDEGIKSERRKASRQELEEISSVLKSTQAESEKPAAKKKPERKPRAKRLSSKKFWLPKRVP